MADKQTKLSVVIRAIDAASAPLKRVNDALSAATKPIRDFKGQLSDLRKNSGLDDVTAAFGGVGNAVSGVLGKIGLIGGALAAATAGVISLIGEFDDLGDKAEQLGVSVDALAQLRHAAEVSGASVSSLDSGLRNLANGIGLARAGSGELHANLSRWSPVLLKQLKASKSNEEAFMLLASAAAKIEDPSKRAAFAMKTLGDSSLAPMLAQGATGIQELRDQFAASAGSQTKAVKAAGKFGGAMDKLKAATTGVKAALVEGLSPALSDIVERLAKFLTENQDKIGEWAKSLGEKIPKAVEWLGEKFQWLRDKLSPIFEDTDKLKMVALGLAAVITGPLLSALATLGVALLTNPVGLIVTGIAVAAALIIKYWDPISAFFESLWAGVKVAFDEAWKFIKGIVDKIAGVVDTVLDAVDTIGSAFRADGSGWAGNVFNVASGNANQPSLADIVRSGQSQTSAKVTVDFANAPRGTRVAADPQSTASVDLSVGYQMIPGSP